MSETQDNTDNIECVNGGIRKRKAISLALKKKIISLYESGYGPSFIARDLNFSISTISSILKDRARIKEHLKGSISLDSAMITRRRSLAICEMEKQLMKWIEQEAKLGKKLTQSCIQNKAYSIYDDIYVRFGDESKIFAASPGWFRRFKTRSKCNISDDSKSTLKKKPVDLVEKFWKDLFKDTTYDGKRIFKLIESDFYWRKLPTSAHHLDNAAELFTQKDDEEVVSLLLCGNINGDFKHKPLLIFPSHKEEFDDLDGFDLPLLYKVNKDSEFTKDLFHDWLSTSFAPAVEKYCEKENIPNKILLVVNQSKLYENADELKYTKHPNIKLVVLPNENIADQRSFDRYFALYFKSYYLQCILVQAIEESENNTNFKFVQYWINYDVYQAIYNIEKAWNEMNVKFLVAMCTFDVVRVLLTAETDKSEKIEEVLEQIIQLANELKIKMNKDNVMNLIDGVKEKKEKIIVVLNGVNQVVDVTKVEDASATGSKPSGFNSKELTMAFYEISSAMRRLQRMDDDAQRFQEVKERIQEALMYYRKMLVFKKE